MKRIVLTVAALGFGIAAARAGDGPIDVVRQLYAQPHPDHSAVYTERLQRLFDADARQADGAVGNLDFDYRLNGTPLTPSTLGDLTFKAADEGKDRAKGTGDGKGGRDDGKDGGKDGGRHETIIYDLVKVGDGWRVDDAHSIGTPKWQLSTILRAAGH